MPAPDRRLRMALTEHVASIKVVPFNLPMCAAILPSVEPWIAFSHDTKTSLVMREAPCCRCYTLTTTMTFATSDIGVDGRQLDRPWNDDRRILHNVCDGLLRWDLWLRVVAATRI
jgi:hypothetical protein